MQPIRPFVFFVLAVLSAVTSSAQTRPPVEPTAPAFVVENDGGDNRLQIGALVHVDGRFTVDDPSHQVIDTFTDRRVRLILQGRVARHFEYFFMPDFAGGTVVVRDAYFDTRLSSALRIRAGKGKIPLGLERLQLVNAILFVERSFVTGLTPDRDTGVQVLGDLSGGVINYAAAVTNGNQEGGTADVDANEGKELSARVIVRPWARNTTAGATNLGVGIAATTGTQGPTLPFFRSPAQQTFFSYAANVTGDGRRTRVSPQIYFYRGRFGGFGEYIRSSGAVRRGAVRSATLENSAWNISGSWLLTGEAATDRVVRPRKSFDPPNRQWGALQIAARYHQLVVDEETFALGLAAEGSSRKAQAVTIGLNWYVNPFVKWVFNVERTVFDEDVNGTRPAENALLLRGQLSF